MKFTPETARIAALNSHKPTSARFAPPEPVVAQPAPVAVPAQPQPQTCDDEFRLRTLSRVRNQMERIFGMMDEEEDPNKLDRLASALDRLAGRERELANRSLPPSQKPIGAKDAKRHAEPTSEPRPACASDTPSSSVLVPIPDPTIPQA